MKTIFAAAALSLGAALCVPASAQAQTEYDANRLVSGVDLAELRNLAAALGYEVLEAREDGRPEVVLRSDTGRTFFLRGYVCKEDDGKAGCEGLLMLARYTQPPGLTPAHVTKADNETVVVKVWINDNDKVRVDRYMILDNGVTFGNLLENIKVYLASNKKAVTTMVEASQGS